MQENKNQDREEWNTEERRKQGGMQESKDVRLECESEMK